MAALALLAGNTSAVAGTDVAVATPDIAFSTTNPVDGSNATIFVTVRNFGDADATSVRVQASLSSNGAALGEATLGLIVAQGQAEAAVSWNVEGEGNVTVTITVTPAEVDANPSNNVAVSVNVFIRARPDLMVDYVDFDNSAPPPGTPAVSVRAQISNIGGSDANYVRVAFYDGVPTATNEIYNLTVLSVRLNIPQQVSFVWGLGPSKGGRHDIYARVEASTPAEKSSKLDNNWASGRLLVLTQFDLIVTGSMTIESTSSVPYNPLLNGFVIVRSGGNLTLKNSTLTILQERDNQFDVIIESGGRLNLWASTITSDFSFGVSLQGTGSLWLYDSSSIDGAVDSTGGALRSWMSTLVGNVTGTFSTLWLDNSTIVGGLTISNTQTTWMSTLIQSGSSAVLTATNLNVEWATLSTGDDTSLVLKGGSVATLRGLTSGGIMVETGSAASIWRLVDFTVSDLSGIPIPKATVDSRFSLNTTTPSSVMTDATGSASAWLLTDLLFGGSPQYVGSYLFLASFTSYHAEAVANLPWYPTLSGDSNRIAVALTFPVIDPTDLFTNATGQQVVSGVWDLVEFKQDGNLYVRGILNINGSFVLDQDWDFQKAIIADSGSINIGSGGSMSSPFKYNIYLFNDSALNANGGAIDANAIVTFGNAAVSLAGGTVVRSSFVLGGTSATLGEGVRATGDQIYASGGASLIIQGATVSMGKVEVLTDGSVLINRSALGVGGNVVLRSTGAGKGVTVADSLISGADLALQGGLIDLSGSQFLVASVSLMWGDVVQVKESSFFAAISGFKGSSTASFWDATYPLLLVDPTALVVVNHKLTLSVIDSNGNIVTGGTFAITHQPDGAPGPAGDLGPQVERYLVASRIVGGVETFEGNYKVTVTAAPGGDAVRYVVMDAARTLTIEYDMEIVLPTALIILASADPASPVQNTQIKIAGTVGLIYEGRGAVAVPSSSVKVSLSWNGSVFADAFTAADGSFEWEGAFAPDANFFGLTLINLSATYGVTSGRASVPINVTEAPPTQLILVLNTERFEKGTNEAFTISGRVNYANGKPADGARVRVTFTIPPQAGEYTAVVDGAGLFEVNVPGRRTASTYSLVVNAHDDRFALDAPAKTVTLTVLAITGTAAGGGLGGLTGYFLIAAAAIAGGVILALIINAKRKSVNYVECGNCGRPAHEGDKKCPSCGVEFEEDIAKCSHCASWIPSNAVRCPKCNTEFKPVDDAIAGEPAAPVAAAPEGVQAEVTTPGGAQKAPVAVKKKVLKTAETAPAPADGPKYENPWDQPGAKPTQPIQPGEDAPKPAEKKPEEKKEKGLFDDL